MSVACMVVLLGSWQTSVAQQTAAEYLKQGIEMVKANKYPESEKAFSECLRLEPQNVECLERRALIRRYHIGYAGALDDYNTLVAQHPGVSDYYAERGSVLQALKRDPEALADFNKAIELKPDDAGAYQERGSYYHVKGDDTRALADLTKSLEYDPNQYVFVLRGIVYEQLKDLDKAVADFTSSIKLDGSNAAPFFRRGVVYFKLSKKDLAEADFARAVELDPKYKARVDAVR